MNEATKTLVFCGIAAATGALAFATRPQPIVVRQDDEVGHALFKDFSDPAKAANLKIVVHNDETGKTSSLDVAKKEGRWVIPSHNDYPADAENQMRDVAISFVDLKVLRIEDAKPSDHELFGVVQPDPDKSQSGTKGVGTLVEVADEASKSLAKLIIGKEVKEAPGQRFVRVPGRDRVYVVKVDPKKFSTKFESWVEADLLKLNPFDVSEVVLKDYSVELAQTLQGPVIKSFDQRFELTAREDTTANKWVAKSFRESKNGDLQDSQLAEGEELSKERLDGLKNALDDLKIVDVERKPNGLGADLKAEKGFLQDQQGVISLFEKGFYPVQVKDQVELLCSDGEIQVRTKDGVEYLLRFGGIASLNQDEVDKGSVNRWLFVTASVDQSQFPEPILEPLPEIPGGGEAGAPTSESAPTSPSATNPPAAEPATSGAPAADPAPSTPAPAADSPAADSPTGASPPAEGAAATSGNGGCGGDDTANADEDAAATPASEGTPPAEGSTPPAAESPATATPDATAAPAQSPAEPPAQPAATAAPAAAAEDAADAREQARKERDRIMKENQRKLDEHNEKLKKAKEKVGELNFRFADWYYIISDEVYRKIHLGRGDVIVVGDAAKKDGAGLESFRDLQQKAQGLNGNP